MQSPAPPSEAHRRGSFRPVERSDPGRDGRGRGTCRRSLWLHRRRHGRVHRSRRGPGRARRRRRPRLLLHGDEHPPPGGTPRHGTGRLRRRPRGTAAARPGRVAAACRRGRSTVVYTVRHLLPGPRDRGPHLRRGPGTGLPAHRRSSTATGRTLGRGHPGGLRNRTRRPDRQPVRPDARQGDRVRARPPDRDPSAAGRTRRDPHPGRHHQHRLPAPAAGSARGDGRAARHRPGGTQRPAGPLRAELSVHPSRIDRPAPLRRRTGAAARTRPDRRLRRLDRPLLPPFRLATRWRDRLDHAPTPARRPRTGRRELPNDYQQ